MIFIYKYIIAPNSKFRTEKTNKKMDKTVFCFLILGFSTKNHLELAKKTYIKIKNTTILFIRARWYLKLYLSRKKS